MEQLAEMYSGEQEIARTLSKISKSTPDGRLKKCLLAYGYQSVRRVSKVAEIFACFGAAADGRKGSTISGLLACADNYASRHQDLPINDTAIISADAVIISAVLEIGNYVIATYSFLRDLANALENPTAVKVLDEILAEEISSHRTLSDLAEPAHQNETYEAVLHNRMVDQEEEALAYDG